MATVGELVVNLVARTAAFNQGMQRSQEQVAQFAQRTNSLSQTVGSGAAKLAAWGAGFVSVGGSIALARRAAGELHKGLLDLSSLGKQSERLGMLPGQVEALKMAAEQAGSTPQRMVEAVERLQRQTAEAAASGGRAAKAIQQLGLNAADLQRMGTAKAMEAIANALEHIHTAGERARLTVDLFGEKAGEIAAALGKLREAQANVKFWDLGHPAAVVAGVTYENQIDQLKYAAKSGMEHAGMGYEYLRRNLVGFLKGGFPGARAEVVGWARETMQWTLGLTAAQQEIAEMQRQVQIAAARAGGQDLLGNMQEGFQFRGLADWEKRTALWMKEAHAAGMAAREVAEFASKLLDVGRISALLDSQDKRRMTIANLVRGQLTGNGDGAELAPLATMGSLAAYQAIARQGMQPSQARTDEEIAERARRQLEVQERIDGRVQRIVQAVENGGGLEVVEIL